MGHFEAPGGTGVKFNADDTNRPRDCRCGQLLLIYPYKRPAVGGAPPVWWVMMREPAAVQRLEHLTSVPCERRCQSIHSSQSSLTDKTPTRK